MRGAGRVGGFNRQEFEIQKAAAQSIMREAQNRAIGKTIQRIVDLPIEFDKLEQSPIRDPYATGWQTSIPTEPINPVTDCDKDPSSPYCGGNPFSVAPIGVEVEVRTSDDGNETCIYTYPVFAFIKGPPAIVCHRRFPEAYPNYEPPIPKPPDQQPIPFKYLPDSCRVTWGATIFQWLMIGGTEVDTKFNPPKPISNEDLENLISEIVSNRKHVAFIQTLEWEELDGEDRPPLVIAHTGKGGFVSSYRLYYLASRAYRNRTNFFGEEIIEYQDYITDILEIRSVNSRFGSFYGNKAPTLESMEEEIFARLQGSWYKPEFTVICDNRDDYDDPYYWGPSIPPAPIPRLPERGNQNMCCCPETNALLRLILRKLEGNNKPFTPFPSPPSEKPNLDIKAMLVLIMEAIEDVSQVLGSGKIETPSKYFKTQSSGANAVGLGVGASVGSKQGKSITQGLNDWFNLIASRQGFDDYPVTVPKTLLDSKDAKDSGEIRLESMPKFVVWIVEQLDALIGQFPIEIEIDDGDLLQRGKQILKVERPNIAETLAEILGFTYSQKIKTELHTDILLRLAVETIYAKNAAIVAQDFARANATYMGYKANPVKREIPSAFNFAVVGDRIENLRENGKFGDITDLLDTTFTYVEGWEEQDPDTLVSYLQKLAFAAGIIKAVFFRGGGTTKEAQREIERISKKETAQDNKDWTEFLRAINNPNSAWNKNSPEKPKIQNYIQNPNAPSAS